MKTRHSPAWRLAAACSTVFAMLTCAPVRAATDMEEAHRAYYLGQTDRALAIYERLAAGGNTEAAERAGFALLLSGNALSGKQPTLDSARAMRHLLQAARAGRAGAMLMLNMLEATD